MKDVVKGVVFSVSNKKWMISTVAIVQYFWSFAFSMNFFISFVEVFSGKEIPQRNLFLFLFLFLLLMFVLIFTSDIRWKAFLKMFFYTLGLVSSLMMLVFLSLVFKYAFLDEADVNLVFAIFCLAVGLVGYLISYKTLKSDFLN